MTAGTGSPLSVLIVDDDPVDRRSVKRAVSGDVGCQGHSWGRSGEDAAGEEGAGGERDGIVAG